MKKSQFMIHQVAAWMSDSISYEMTLVLFKSVCLFLL